MMKLFVLLGIAFMIVSDASGNPKYLERCGGGINKCAMECKDNGSACFNLGVVYEEGYSSITKDVEKASKYYRMSCDKKHLAGCASLGVVKEVYENDIKAAAKIYNTACEQGNAAACSNLGRAYVSKDLPSESESAWLKNSQKYYAKSCEIFIEYCGPMQNLIPTLKNEELYLSSYICGGEFQINSCRLAGRLSETTIDDNSKPLTDTSTAVRYYEASTADGLSRYSLAMIYMYGRGNVEIDYVKAAHWLELSCDLEYKPDDAHTCASLALIYDEGLSGEKDDYKATRYYAMACEGEVRNTDGTMPSCHHAALRKYKGKGTEVEKDVAARYAFAACKSGISSSCKLYESLR